MGSPLPYISEPDFYEQLERAVPIPLSRPDARVLFVHYQELRRWNQKLSLIGPGTVEDLVIRHYGESLAALRFLRYSDRHLVDIGTGGGFPGLVLALAAPPGLNITLFEARQRKWAFLEAVVRKAAALRQLSCRCLNARVDQEIPASFPRKVDVVTFRALKITPSLLELLSRHSPETRFLLWQGAETPELPPGLRIAREVALAGSVHRRILELVSSSE